MPDVLPIRPRGKAAPGNRVAFTSKRLEDFQCPPGVARIELRDATCAGLRLRVTENGVKTFSVLRRVNGRLARLPIGRFPDVPLDAARKRAQRLLLDVADGIDPRAARREARHGLTFGDLAADFIEHHAKPRKKTWSEDQRQVDHYLSAWKARPIAEIQRHHVAILHAKVGKEHGPYQANRLLALISSLFGFAERERGWKGGNPAKGVRRFKEEKRVRFLQPAEMPEFFAAVDAEVNETIRDFVYVALLTGARRSNLQAMRWCDLDLTAATWTIPETKSGKSVVVPLIPTVVAILRRRFTGGEYVFPGRSRGHLQEPKNAWRNILDRAGISNLRLHDLRRSFGSYLAAAGVSLPIIAKSLGHESTAATQVYARLNLEPVRQAVELATAAMLQASKRKGKKK